MYNDIFILQGLDSFKSYIEPLFFNYISDATSSVRETGIKCLEVTIAHFIK
jgi:hypothetical protein